jgi:hypothetical protein
LLCRAIGVPGGWQQVRRAGAADTLASPTHPARGERVERFVRLDDEIRARVHADSPCDLALYRWAARGEWRAEHRKSD